MTRTSRHRGQSSGCLLVLIMLALVGVAVYYYGVPKLPWTSPPAPPPATLPSPTRSPEHAPAKPVKPTPIVATKPVDPTRDQKLAAARATPLWIEAKRAADALETKLEAARRSGDQQAIMAASFKWIEAKDRVGQIEQAALERK